MRVCVRACMCLRVCASRQAGRQAGRLIRSSWASGDPKSSSWAPASGHAALVQDVLVLVPLPLLLQNLAVTTGLLSTFVKLIAGA